MRPLGLSAAALRHPKSQRRPPPTSLLDVLPTLVCRPCKLLQTSAPASSQALVGGSPRRPTTTAGASTGMLALNHCGSPLARSLGTWAVEKPGEQAEKCS